MKAAARKEARSIVVRPEPLKFEFEGVGVLVELVGLTAVGSPELMFVTVAEIFIVGDWATDVLVLDCDKDEGRVDA